MASSTAGGRRDPLAQDRFADARNDTIKNPTEWERNLPTGIFPTIPADRVRDPLDEIAAPCGLAMTTSLGMARLKLSPAVADRKKSRRSGIFLITMSLAFRQSRRRTTPDSKSNCPLILPCHSATQTLFETMSRPPLLYQITHSKYSHRC